MMLTNTNCFHIAIILCTTSYRTDIISHTFWSCPHISMLAIVSTDLITGIWCSKLWQFQCDFPEGFVSLCPHVCVYLLHHNLFKERRHHAAHVSRSRTEIMEQCSVLKLSRHNPTNLGQCSCTGPSCMLSPTCLAYHYHSEERSLVYGTVIMSVIPNGVWSVKIMTATERFKLIINCEATIAYKKWFM